MKAIGNGQRELAKPEQHLMPVRLRGHHFLCILTYKGLGYSKPFTRNMDNVIARIGNGAQIMLREGPDDICGGLTEACRAASGHDCSDVDMLKMDSVAVEAVENVLGRQLRDAAPVTPAELEILRAHFASGALRRACARCPWFYTCTEIASAGFAETHLHSPPQMPESQIR
jgi:uncharacterized protein